MAGINRWEGWGMVTRPELKELESGATPQSFTLLVKGAEYSREAKGDVVSQTWVPCERFLRDDYTEHDLVYQGDYAHVVAEYTQSRGSDGKDHSRMRVLVLTVTRRGRGYRDAIASMPAATRTPDPAPGAGDPWAMGQ